MEITSKTYIDSRIGKKMFQLTMNNGGKVSTSVTPYEDLLNKKSAELKLCDMITYLCEEVYNIHDI